MASCLFLVRPLGVFLAKITRVIFSETQVNLGESELAKHRGLNVINQSL